MATAGAIAIDADPVTVLNAVRFALGDNGTRTIPEFVAFAHELANDLAAAIARAEAAERFRAVASDLLPPWQWNRITDWIRRQDREAAIAAQQAEGE